MLGGGGAPEDLPLDVNLDAPEDLDAATCRVFSAEFPLLTNLVSSELIWAFF